MWRTSNPRNHRAWVTTDARLPSSLSGDRIGFVTRQVTIRPSPASPPTLECTSQTANWVRRSHRLNIDNPNCITSTCGFAARTPAMRRQRSPGVGALRAGSCMLYKYSAHWRRAKRSRITHAHRNMQQSARRCLGRENLRIGCLRHISSVAPNRGEGLLTERIAGAQPERREPLFMPLSSQSRTPRLNSTRAGRRHS